MFQFFIGIIGYLNLGDTEESSQEQTRMAVDIVAGLSETEAVIQYRRLTGISQGSFLDIWD